MKEYHSQNCSPSITSFTGDFSFLSTFYPSPLSYMGQLYANAEAAFQAQKTLSAKEQQRFCMFRMHNPSEAKKLGRKLPPP